MLLDRTTTMVLLDPDETMTVNMPYLDELLNGSPAKLRTVPVDVKGTITDQDGTKVSDIVPLVVLINQADPEWVPCVDALVGVGHDLHQIFDYYGKPTTPWDVIRRCAVRSSQYMARRRRQSPRTTKGTRPVRYSPSQPMKKQK